jgi:glyceraldehyde 3-phosphate dehydrogenase
LILVFCQKKEISVDSLNQAFKSAAKGYLKDIMAVTSEKLVSSDFSGNPFSVVIDLELTEVCGRMAKVFGWYDNEWAYSERLKDFLLFVA